MSTTTTPPPSGSTSGGKRKHRCLTCCIICLVVVALFIGAVIGGSAIAFNKFVSPMIGGVKFGSAVKLMSGVYTGERNRKKILTDTYTEEDLSTFYDELNAHLFQKVRSTDELTAEYNALSDADKAQVLADLNANKKWKTMYETADDKSKLVVDYYVSANRYPLTVAKLLSAVNLTELSSSSNTSTRQMEEVEAFLSTEPERRLAAAAEAEEGEGAVVTTGAEPATEGTESEDDASALNKLLSQLHFDFTDNGLLGQFDYTKDETYAANIASVTFEITGNQIAALVGEVVAQVLSSIDLNEKMGGDDIGIDLSTIYLPDYVLIPQVIIEHKTDLPDNPTQEQLDDYNKNTYVAVTLEMRFRALLNNKDLQNAVKARLSEVAPNASLVNVGFGVMKGILPKTLFVTMGIYPLDSEREAYIKINNYSEKLQGELSKVINALAGDANIFDESKTQPAAAEAATAADNSEPTFLNSLNKKVVSVFSTMDEKGIPLTFVDITREEKRNTVGLRLAHVQMLLQMMNAYDPTGQDGITPYLFMTVLKCLFSNPNMVAPTEGDLDALYTEIQDKYGINKAYWEGGSLLDSDKMNNITSNLDIKEVNLRDNETMKVNLLDKQLLSLFVRAKEDGTLDKFISGDTAVAAAAEAEENTTDVNNLISSLNMSRMDIHRVGDTTVYTLSVRATMSITNLLGDALKNEQSILQTFVDAIPQSLSLGITVYMHTDADGNVTYVGANEDGTDATGFLINAFDENYTLRVINTLSTLMRCLGGGDVFQLDSIREKVDSAFGTVFDTIEQKLYCSIGVKEGTLVLPSLYEVVQGFSKQKIQASKDAGGQLTDADLLTTEEIRQVLNSTYHPTFAPTKYVGTPGDAMLADLQSKYYLAEAWTAEDLFGGTVNLEDKMNADSINFRDVEDGEGNTVTVGLYRDTRPLDALKVNITGDALADLLQQSGKLDDLNKDNDSVIKKISVVNCAYYYDSAASLTYADFIFLADLVEQEVAAAGESAGEGEGDSTFSMETLLPDSVYLTARILLNDKTGTYTVERFDSALVVNGNQATTDDLFTLIKVFSGESFDSDKITEQVSTSVRDAFATIEDNVNFVYGTTVADYMQLDTVFNTINKISNKPTEAEKADPLYVPYASNLAEDQALCNEMREFGRDPATTTKTIETEVVIDTVDVTSYHDIFGIYYHDDGDFYIPTSADQAAFFADLNDHFYIVDNEKKLDIDKVNSGDLVVDNTYISLAALYQDTRPYGDLKTYASDLRMASIIDAMYAEGIDVKNGTDTIGKAFVLAVHVTPQYMQMFVQVKVDENSENAKVLPEYLYLTSKTYLVDPDGDGELEKYDTEIEINNLSKADTIDLFARINKLSSSESLKLNFKLTMEDVTGPIKTQLQTVFDTKIKSLGNVKYNNGNMEIPTIFAYLADGKLTKDEISGDSNYDTANYMVDIDISGYKDGLGNNNYYDTTLYPLHTAETDVNKTNAETLMYRMRELGKAQYTVGYGDNVLVWQGGRPSVDPSGAKYNDNRFVTGDVEGFYDQLQAYYFFKERPDYQWFKEGATNIFDDISHNLDTTFNLTGYVSDFEGDMYTYAEKGLYNYAGTQYGARLTDKAMGALMKQLSDEDNLFSITAENIDGIDITSIKLSWDQDEKNLTIEITVEVSVNPGASALPSKFYMTTVTVRNSTNPAAVVYTTEMTLNGFAFDDGSGNSDLTKFINNLAHIDTLDIKKQLDTEKICDNVTDALKKMLDTKLKDYIVPFNDYGADADGYIELYNVYHQIVDKLFAETGKTDEENKEIIATKRGIYQHADEDIMYVIYKLHNVNTSVKGVNESEAGDEIALNLATILTTNPITDRQFATVLRKALQGTKPYVNSAKSIFFVGDQDTDVYNGWETIIQGVNGGFAFADGDNYVLATIEIDLATAGVTSSVASLLPTYIYATVLVYVDGSADPIALLNDFTADQTALMESFVANPGNLNVKEAIETYIGTYLAGVTYEANTDTTYADYVGQAKR